MELGEALDVFLTGPDARLLADPQAGDVSRIAGLFGASARTQNPALATELSGATDKRSAKYKAAIRTIQRWRSTTATERRRPSKRSVRRFPALVRAGKIRPFRGGGLVRISGLVRVSADERWRTVQGPMTGLQLRPALHRWKVQDLAGAGAALERDFASATGVPFEFENVDEVSIS